MSGGSVSYNLRPNKAVERQLFIELLRKIIGKSSPDDYAYVSMGGPQLEDMKLVNHELDIKNLLSLEAFDWVHKRQLFNIRPYTECLRATTGEFIDDLIDTKFSEQSLIIWLDYASAKERYEQLVEFERLLDKLYAGDVLKITVNATAITLGEQEPGENSVALNERRIAKLRNTLSNYVVEPLPSQISQKTFPTILCKSIKKAILNAIGSHKDIEPVPVAIFQYQDSDHVMLTYTIALVKKPELSDFTESLKTQGWRYFPKDWDDITKITIPNLTVKERLLIESSINSKNEKVEDIHRDLPFWFNNDEQISLNILKEYLEHYRRYPSYLQVII